MTKTRVVVAMSGGVDSSVAAALLVEQGYEVIGISMQLFDHRGDSEERFDSCCSLSDMHDARSVAHKLGIPHYVVNYEQQFKSGVMDYFAQEYAKGRTPNPCVMCNSKLKFDHLIERAQALGADWVATGHYAKVVHFSDGRPSELRKAKDLSKDQSYFLFSIKPEFLGRILFPLADLTKSQVRDIAGRWDLSTTHKSESQEICFVTGKRYSDFLEENYSSMFGAKGNIVDREGKVLGVHTGIHNFTVGQRKKLNLASNQDHHVAALDPENQTVIVDRLENLGQETIVIDGTNWFVDSAALNGMTVQVVPRYHGKAISATMQPGTRAGQWILNLAERARWVSPGQAAVIYQEDRVIGGGFINAQKQADVPKGNRVAIPLESSRV
jgi:tRNA-specific 2-thiouridylase